jgi:hypothetical protein
MLISHCASPARGKRKRNSFSREPGSSTTSASGGTGSDRHAATERMLPAPSEPGQTRGAGKQTRPKFQTHHTNIRSRRSMPRNVTLSNICKIPPLISIIFTQCPLSPLVHSYLSPLLRSPPPSRPPPCVRPRRTRAATAGTGGRSGTPRRRRARRSQGGTARRGACGWAGTRGIRTKRWGREREGVEELEEGWLGHAEVQERWGEEEAEEPGGGDDVGGGLLLLDAAAAAVRRRALAQAAATRRWCVARQWQGPEPRGPQRREGGHDPALGTMAASRSPGGPPRPPRPPRRCVVPGELPSRGGGEGPGRPAPPPAGAGAGPGAAGRRAAASAAVWRAAPRWGVPPCAAASPVEAAEWGSRGGGRGAHRSRLRRRQRRRASRPRARRSSQGRGILFLPSSSASAQARHELRRRRPARASGATPARA